MAKNVTRKTVTKRNRKNIEREQHTFIQALTIQ